MPPLSNPYELKSRTEKLPCFQWIRDEASRRWGKLRYPGSYDDDCYRLAESDLKRPYVIRIWSGGYLGLSLEPDAPDVGLPINFNFHKSEDQFDAQRTAARLYSDGSAIFLVHDGRISKRVDNRPRPTGNEKITINGRTYYVVAQIGSSRFFEDIVAYNESRLEYAAFKKLSSKDAMRYGADKGQKGSFSRGASDANPLHSFIVEELEKRLSELGYKDSGYPYRGPDLFMEKNGRRILFEVKPGHSFTELTTALGQLAVYGAENKPDLKVCICQRGGWPHPRLEQIFKAQEIQVIEFDLSAGSELMINFPTLEQQLSTHKF
jgi:hypothetical protein